MNIDLQLTLLVRVKRRNAGPAQRGSEQTFTLAQMLEKADAHIDMLIGECQHWRQGRMQGTRGCIVPCGKKPEHLDIYRVHGGGDKRVHAAVQRLRHLRRSPATTYMQGTFGRIQYGRVLRARHVHFNLQAPKCGNLLMQQKDIGQGEPRPGWLSLPPRPLMSGPPFLIIYSLESLCT